MKVLFALLLIFSISAHADQLTDAEFDAFKACYQGIQYKLTDQQKQNPRRFTNLTYVKGAHVGQMVDVDAIMFMDTQATPPGFFVFQKDSQTRTAFSSNEIRRAKCDNGKSGAVVPVSGTGVKFCWPSCPQYYARVNFGTHTYQHVENGQWVVDGTEQYLCRHGRDQNLEILSSRPSSVPPKKAFQLNNRDIGPAVSKAIIGQLQFIASHIGPGTASNLDKNFDNVFKAGGPCFKIVDMLEGQPQKLVDGINCLKTNSQTPNCLEFYQTQDSLGVRAQR